jgi:hypothetical protein
MKCLIQTLLTLLLTLGTSTAILAAPPPNANCPDPDPEKPEEVYSRLECRQQGIANQLTYTSDTVFGDGTPLHGRIKPARLAHIKNGANKAERAALKNDAKMFKRLAKAESKGNKGQDLGHLVPLNSDNDKIPAPDGDGICDYEQGKSSAKCAAIEVDQNGELQECNPKKKNKGKGKDGLECDRFVEDDDEADMVLGAMEMEDTYSAVESNLVEMNIILDDINDTLEEDAVLLNLENGSCDIPEVDGGLNAHVMRLREIHAAAFGAARITADVTGTDFLGNNALWVAAAFDTAALATNIAYLLADSELKSQNAGMQAAIMECTAKTAALVAELKDLMQKEHADIINVLNTPHGQRDQHPKL